MFRAKRFWVPKAIFLAGSCLGLLAACSSGSDLSRPDPTTATTLQGPVQGVEDTGVVRFLSIPYAAPPVGQLRWKAPAAAPNRTSTLVANTLPPLCAPQTDGKEDCLYLNVYKPTAASKLPVLVWIHGGGFSVGGSRYFDGTSLAKNNNVIVVTLNYRLGPLGFFAHPGLSAEAGGRSGNYGILDQQAALQWVRANIESFGGDSKNVTVFGVSAGGNSLYTQLISPLATGLFDKAAIFSGAYVRQQPTLAAAETVGLSEAAKLGCAGRDASAIACLRALPVASVTLAGPTNHGYYSPIIDNYVITESTASAFSAGRFQKVPMITGSTHDEGNTIFIPGSSQDTYTAANYAHAVSNYLLGVVSPSDIAAQYPVSSFTIPARAYAAALGDYKFFCGMVQEATAIAKYVPNSWAYQFAEQNPVQQIPDADPSVAPGSTLPWFGPWGDYHSSDVTYWFDLFTTEQRTPDNVALSTSMRAYLANFARDGDPNGQGLPTWPRATVAGLTMLNLASPIVTNFQAVADHRCDYWRTVPPSPNLL